jgi:hypothetical protein
MVRRTEAEEVIDDFAVCAKMAAPAANVQNLQNCNKFSYFQTFVNQCFMFFDTMCATPSVYGFFAKHLVWYRRPSCNENSAPQRVVPFGVTNKKITAVMVKCWCSAA